MNVQRKRRKFFFSILAILGVIASGFVQASAASAIPGYPVTLGTTAGGIVLVGPNNNPIVKDCNSYRNIMSYSASNGSLLYQKNQASTGFIDFGCNYATWGSLYPYNEGQTNNIASSGVVVAAGNSSASAVVANRVQGYTGSTLSWTYTVKNECNQTASLKYSPVVSGNVVAVPFISCNAGGGAAMRQLNATTGALIGSPLYLGNVSDDKGIHPYTGGFVVQSGNVTRFINFSNAIVTSATLNVGDQDLLAFSPEGDVVYKEVTNDPDYCNVVFRTLAGVTTTRYLLCSDIPTTLSTSPAGDLVGQKMTPQGGVDPTNPTVRIIHKTGSTVISDIAVSKPSGIYLDYLPIMNLQVDALGNVIVLSAFTNSNNNQEAQVNIFSSGGDLKGKWTSESLPNGVETSFDVFNAALALGNGAIYVNDYIGKQLIGITSSSTRMSYQDKVRWGITTTSPTTERTYIALGDSYSSGQGNPGYEPGTDEKNVNECRRSYDAYPQVLADDLDSFSNKNLNLVSFRACGGATTKDVLGLPDADNPHGSWGETPQIAALTANPNVDIVSITVGGNDVGFEDYAKACWLGVCDTGSVPYNNIVSNINSSTFQTNLKNTYKAILDDTNHADVYIMDYPKLVVDNPDDSCVAFNKLLDETGADNSNDTAVQYVSNLLNSTIASAYLSVISDPLYSAKANRLHFVPVNNSGSPFEGHDFCSDHDLPSYKKMFYVTENVQFWDDQPQALHPTVKGQHAYAEILANAIN